DAGHRRFPSVASWQDAQADRAAPTTFALGAERVVAGASDGAVDIDVDVTHTPSLDPFVGLVPGRAREVWRVHHQADGWRVEPDASSADPVLPPDGAAVGAVQAWLDRSSQCDPAGAAALHAVPHLSGPVGLQ